MKIQFKKGSKRFVILFGKKLVIKIAKIKVIKFFKDFDFWWWKEAYKPGVSLNSRMKMFFEMNFHHLYLGFMENVYEFYTYQKTKSVALTPTYFSFLGLINFCKYETGVGKIKFSTEKSFFDFLILFDGVNDDFMHECANCAHSLEKSENLAFDGQKAKIIDYGEKYFLKLILNYEDKIEELLDLIANE